MLILSEHVQKALSISNRQFKRLFGVKRQTFHQMPESLQEAFDTLHQRGGKPPAKLRVEDRLMITLQYRRQLCLCGKIVIEGSGSIQKEHAKD